MSVKITKRWLKKHKACCSDKDMQAAEEIGDPIAIIKKLFEGNRYKDAIWLITMLFTKKQNVELALFAARQVVPFFEKEFPRLAKYLANKITKKEYSTAATDAYYAATTYDAYAIKATIIEYGIKGIKQ